jgi:hypothetical protein
MNVIELIRAVAPLRQSLKAVESLEPGFLAHLTNCQQPVDAPVTVAHDSTNNSIVAAALGFIAHAKSRPVIDGGQAFLEYVFFVPFEHGAQDEKVEVFRFYLDSSGKLWSSGESIADFNDVNTVKAIAYRVLEGVLASKLLKKRPTA